MKICDFYGQILSDSYFCFVLLRMARKTFNSKDPDLYDHEQVTFIHPVINAQLHAKVGLPFFDTPCVVKHKIT